ncbi:MAG: hypothetical protein PVG78_18575 [Desulfobacterales bacterium]|jgi:hypothetical protein
MNLQTKRSAAEDLAAAGASIPAVVRNTERIKASVKMLELEFSDLLELDILDGKV